MNKSLHNLSIRWLCTLRPAMWLPRSGQRSGWFSVHNATITFSPPLSERTRDGRPNTLTACWKSLNTVLALLFVLHLRNTIIRENPSIPPWITKRHLYRSQEKWVDRMLWWTDFNWCHATQPSFLAANQKPQVYLVLVLNYNLSGKHC